MFLQIFHPADMQVVVEHLGSSFDCKLRGIAASQQQNLLYSLAMRSRTTNVNKIKDVYYWKETCNLLSKGAQLLTKLYKV